MHQVDLSRIDLNLLVVFEALVQERHVGRAAKRLSLSPSATSHALGRLRELLDDPLFVKNPRGIEPTPQGRELTPPILDALAQVRRALAPRQGFDPARLRRTFRVAAHDFAMLVLMPGLMAALREQAPGVALRCLTVHPDEVIGRLDRGELDFALGGFVGMSAERITRTVLFADRFVGVVRRGHPRLHDGRMSLDDLVAIPHVVVSPGGETRGDIDQALTELGRERQVAITTPTFLALPFVVETTDVIGVLPERLATRLAGATSLSLFELPLTVAPVTCSHLALAPLAGQDEMRWLLGLLRRAAA